MTHNQSVTLKNKIDNQIKRCNDRLKYLYTQLTFLQEDCPHQEKIEKTKYFEGSYFNTSYYEHYTICSVCNKTLDVKQTLTNSYP